MLIFNLMFINQTDSLNFRMDNELLYTDTARWYGYTLA